MRDALCSPLRLCGVFKKESQQSDDTGKSNSDARQQYSALPEGICRQFSLAEIKAATNNFCTDLEIGIGGFGIVYKGTIDDGTTVVAVKRFQRSSSPDITTFFQTEVLFLCQLRHPLLVFLIGFCEERNEMILVYEYMSRGTLSDHLYGKAYAPIPWKQRLEICIAAAQGLHYLHTGAKYAVIHGHIKSLNILLDEELSCKLHGFGFSKMGSHSLAKASKVIKESTVMGTFGYIAPEYAIDGELTEKSDVFSFGVILFEVLFGRIAYDSTLSENQQNILDWASEIAREGTIYHVIDPYLKGRIAPECLKKYLEIACSCVHYNGNERPSMGEVEVTLELALELQEKADSEMEGIKPHRKCVYVEASFCTSVSNFGLLR
ncbi:hypothetical protein CRYUN_Cryun23aG0030000 [Craigia yunnanensis]